MSTLGNKLRRRVVICAAMAAFTISVALPQQVVLAGSGNPGPVAPPPGKAAARSCISKGKIGIKTTRGCIVKLGPVAPPPGM